VVAKQVLDDKPVTEHFTPKWELIDTPEKLQWLEDEVNKTTLIGFDTESPHLRMRRCPLMTLQISWGWDNTAVIPMYKHDPNAPKEQEYHLLPAFGVENRDIVKGFVNRVFGNPMIAKAAHNFKYDENVLRWEFQVRIKGFKIDTMVEKHLMNELPPSDLEYLCDSYFHWGDYSAKRRAITGQGKKLRNTFDKVTDEILWPYGATDALGTFRLACVLTQELQQKHPNLWQFYCEESEPLITALAEAEYKGALMDMNVHVALGVEWEKELTQLRTDTRSYLWPDFNPMSNPDVLKAFQSLGIPDVDLEDKDAASGYSTNKKKLNDLVEKGGIGAQLAEHIMKYRNRNKMVSTYLVNAKNDLDTDGRVRYSWHQAGPVTGRLSCRFFHQIPKIDEERVKQGQAVMRDLFIAPDGYEYVYGDFSQVELRILAILAQDSEMLAIMADPNGDLHKATAFEFLSSVWPGLKEEDINKFNRTEVGKRVNFGLAYGSEGHALVKTGKWQDAKGKERNFTWDMLNKGMARWKSRFVGVGTFIDNMPDVVRSYQGTATNVFGRERHFGPLLNHQNDFERGTAERECVNYFIQSVASCLTNRTISAVDKMLEEFNISEDIVCLVNTVHDSVAYEVRSDYVPWFKTALTAISMQPWPQLFNNQFRMDVGSGRSWAIAEMAA
jgi:DNA polymerase-1